MFKCGYQPYRMKIFITAMKSSTHIPEKASHLIEGDCISQITSMIRPTISRIHFRTRLLRTIPKRSPRSFHARREIKNIIIASPNNPNISPILVTSKLILMMFIDCGFDCGSAFNTIILYHILKFFSILCKYYSTIINYIFARKIDNFYFIFISKSINIFYIFLIKIIYIAKYN